jgi:argininosuccinate synthase
MKIVLAYSGGLDTSVLLTWLKETYSAEIIAFCADVGQEEELHGLDAKAFKTGASKCFIEDLREEFARDFIFPMMQASAIYEGQYFLGTSIARPCIAKKMVEIAKAERADAVAHGATGKGNDQVRFELTAAALAPELQVIAPWRQERFREQFPRPREMIAYAEKHQIPVQASAKKPYSMDRNLLHISFEAGILEDPWFDASAEKAREMYILSVSPEEAPDKAEHVELTFEKGICTAVGYNEIGALLKELGSSGEPKFNAHNHAVLSPLWVMRVLNKLGGRHGCGRVDMVEKPFRRHEIARCLRNARRQHPALRAPADGEHHDGPRGHAPARHAHPEIRRAGVLRLLVRARARGAAGAGHGVAEKRERHRAGETLQRATSSPRAANPRFALQSGDRHDGGRPDEGLQPNDATGFIALNALRLKVAARVHGVK